MKIQAISQAVLESINVSSRDASSSGTGAGPGIRTLKGTALDWTIRRCYIVPVWNLVDYTSYVYVHVSWTECMTKQGSFLFLYNEAFSLILLVQKRGEEVNIIYLYIQQNLFWNSIRSVKKKYEYWLIKIQHKKWNTLMLNNTSLSTDAPWRWLWTVAETCRSAFIFRNECKFLVMNFFICINWTENVQYYVFIDNLLWLQ